MKRGRKERVASAIRQEVAIMLLTETKDPGLQGVVVTGARVTPDLRYVFLTYELHDDSESGRAHASQALQRAEGWLRRHIGRRLRLRIVPELRFQFDDRIHAVQKISSILGDLDTPKTPGDDGQGGP